MKEYRAFNAIDGAILCAPNRKALKRAVRITSGRWYFDNERRRGVSERFTDAFIRSKEVEWESEANAALAEASKQATLWFWSNSFRAGK